MNSADTIALPIRLHVEVGAYLIPVIPKFSACSLILKGIRDSHKSWYTDITHYPKGYVFIPTRFKRIRYCFAVIEERNSGKYRWKLFGKEAICEKPFVKFIGRYFIHKICILFIHWCIYLQFFINC